MLRRGLVIAGIAAAALAGAPAGEAQQEGATVSVGDAAYSPPTVRVLSRTTVTWRWDGANRRHSVTSDPGQAESFDSDPGESPLAVDHAAGETFAHFFARPGEYRYHDKVSCAPATSSASCGSGMTGVVIVENRPPVAGFAIQPSPARPGEAVRFDASRSSDADGRIARHDWDLDGDGAYELANAGAAVSRTYDAAGSYPISLRVTDDLGATHVRTLYLLVEAPPPPAGPGAQLLVSARQPLVALRRSGVSMLVSCVRACAIDAHAVARGVTRSAVAALSQPGSVAVEVPLARGALARLRARRSVPVEVRVAALSADGARQELTRRVRLRAAGPPRARVGISDQRPPSFGEPLFRALGLRHARLITPWDSIFTERAALEDWIGAARAAGLVPFVAFERDRASQCPAQPCRGPSRAEYARALRAFLRAFPDVRTISPWNEANHQSQPTGRRPRLAAAYYDVARRVCRRCRIVAADLLDSPNMARWLRGFRRGTRARPRLWGLHNYSDTNRFRTRGTRALLRLVPGEVWLTETGGVVRFETAPGRVALPYDEERAGRSVEFLFDLAARHPRRIKRVYLYQWRKNFPADRFDAGLVGLDGTPRAGYEALRQALRRR